MSKILRYNKIYVPAAQKDKGKEQDVLSASLLILKPEMSPESTEKWHVSKPSQKQKYVRSNDVRNQHINTLRSLCLSTYLNTEVVSKNELRRILCLKDSGNNVCICQQLKDYIYSDTLFSPSFISSQNQIYLQKEPRRLHLSKRPEGIHMNPKQFVNLTCSSVLRCGTEKPRIDFDVCLFGPGLRILSFNVCSKYSINNTLAEICPQRQSKTRNLPNQLQYASSKFNALCLMSGPATPQKVFHDDSCPQHQTEMKTCPSPCNVWIENYTGPRPCV